MNLTQFKEVFADSQICYFMSTDGVIIESKDPIIGEGKVSLCIKTEIDNTSNQREYPKPGDRLDNYHVNRETGAWHTTPSHWVVWRVEVFNSADENQVMREVVIAWCKKEPVTQN
ncbi:hypothetical protein LC593_06905 [Nostoc sp. CHAB 5844]|nr:hypothetical protein [Nostoc sp. CHAB 5844]